AIAIGLSKARRAGVDLPPPRKGKTSERTRQSAQRAYARGHGARPKRRFSPKRSHAIHRALERVRLFRGLARSACEASAFRRPASHRRRTIESGQKGIPDKRTGQTACGCHESPAHEGSCRAVAGGKEGSGDEATSCEDSRALKVPKRSRV